MKKVKLVLFQLIAIFFLVNGIKKIYFAVYSDEMDCVLKFMKNTEVDCWDETKSGRIMVFINDIYLFPLYTFLAIVIIILILNLVLKFSWKTTITVFILSFFLIWCIQSSFVNPVLNSLGRIFSDNLLYKYVIESLTYTVIGIVFLLLSIKTGKEDKEINQGRNAKNLVEQT